MDAKGHSALVLREGAPGRHMTVLVTGVARGGTSMVAGVVRELGVDLGANLGPNHEDPQFLPTAPRAIRKVVAARNAAKDVWGWKMPHAVDHLHRVERRLRNPHVIVVFRNTMAVVRSRMRRQGITADEALRTTLQHQAAAGRAAARTRAALLLVDYEAALREPEAFVDRVAAFLHLAPDASQREAAATMVDPRGGYRRSSGEAWRLRALEPGTPKAWANLVAGKARRNVGFRVENGRPVATAARPFMEFPVSCSRCVLAMERVEGAEEVRICVDVGRGYSLNMAERATLRQGRNRFEIEHDTLRGVRLFPTFRPLEPGGDPVANVRLVRLLVPRET